jgi:hypothetical protein
MRLQRLLLLTPLWLGCQGVTSHEDDLLVVTDRTEYRTGTDSLAPVRLSLRNQGAVALDVPRCDIVTIYVDRRTASRWVQVARYGEICPAIYDMSPVRLHPGLGHEAGPLGLGIGRYRLRVPFGRAGEDVRQWTSVSNVFTIHGG